MSTTTQTPITKEGLIELGFERSKHSSDFFELSKGTVTIWIDPTGICIGAALYKYIGMENMEEVEVDLKNLKFIEQLKTIIEVCL